MSGIACSGTNINRLAAKERKPRLFSRGFLCGHVAGLFPFHGLEKLIIGLGDLEFVNQELNGVTVVHAVEQFAQNPHSLQFVFSHQ